MSQKKCEELNLPRFARFFNELSVGIVGNLGALPSVSGHDGRKTGFGVLILPPQSVSFVRFGLIPNCRQCEPWEGAGGNASCIP